MHTLYRPITYIDFSPTLHLIHFLISLLHFFHRLHHLLISHHGFTHCRHLFGVIVTCFHHIRHHTLHHGWIILHHFHHCSIVFHHHLCHLFISHHHVFDILTIHHSSHHFFRHIAIISNCV